MTIDTHGSLNLVKELYIFIGNRKGPFRRSPEQRGEGIHERSHAGALKNNYQLYMYIPFRLLTHKSAGQTLKRRWTMKSNGRRHKGKKENKMVKEVAG
jgi:hypothetical protein